MRRASSDARANFSAFSSPPRSMASFRNSSIACLARRRAWSVSSTAHRMPSHTSHFLKAWQYLRSSPYIAMRRSALPWSLWRRERRSGPLPPRLLRNRWTKVSISVSSRISFVMPSPPALFQPTRSAQAHRALFEPLRYILRGFEFENDKPRHAADQSASDARGPVATRLIVIGDDNDFAPGKRLGEFRQPWRFGTARVRRRDEAVLRSVSTSFSPSTTKTMGASRTSRR